MYFFYAALMIVGGFLIGYMVSTLIESILHQKISDAPKKTVNFWMRYPRFFAIFINANYSHHVIHHRKTFRKNYVTEFEDDQERNALDKVLAARGTHGNIIRKSHYAIKLQGTGVLVFILPFIPVIALLFTISPPMFAGAFSVATTLSPLLNNFIHPYLHMPHEEAIRRAPKGIVLFLKTSYFRKMIRHHYVHHKYVACNFNLLLGGDWLRQSFRNFFSRREAAPKHRVNRLPSATDEEEMRKLGLPMY